MFFGAAISKGVAFALTPEDGRILHLSNACFDVTKTNANCTLVLSQGGKDHVLCSLRSNDCENVPLDLFVDTSEGGELKVGNCSRDVTVHVTGYYEPGMDSDDESNDDNESLDSDCVPTLKQLALEAKGMDEEVDSDEEPDSDDDDEDINGLTKDDEDDDDDDEDDDDEEEEDEEEDEEPSPVKTKPMKKIVQKVDTKQAVPVKVTVDKKRKASESLPAPGKKVAKNGSGPDGQFQNIISEYLKKHGRSMIAQVASACPKPSGVTKKYREFLVGCPSFHVDGMFVSIKS